MDAHDGSTSSDRSANGPCSSLGRFDRESLFVEHGAIRAQQLHSPLAGVLVADGGAAVCAVTNARVGFEAELHGAAQAIALIPAVLDRGGGRRLDLRVEE